LIADMAALGDIADVNQLAFSAARATAAIDAADARHQLASILRIFATYVNILEVIVFSGPRAF